MATTPMCIIAYIGEGEQYDAVVDAAMEAATGAEARLIIYDADAGSRFGSPLPTFWSGDTDAASQPHILSAQQLEAAGRADMAGRVSVACARGIDAAGWLPQSRGAKDFAKYAQEQQADLLVIPSDLEHTGVWHRLVGVPTAEGIVNETPVPVVTVDVHGELGAVALPESA
ncbi:MAG: hypothetical protein ACKVT1_08025 [Dehalococcoidia bacterium]